MTPLAAENPLELRSISGIGVEEFTYTLLPRVRGTCPAHDAQRT